MNFLGINYLTQDIWSFLEMNRKAFYLPELGLTGCICLVKMSWRVTGVWNTWRWDLLCFACYFLFLIWRNSNCCRFPPESRIFSIPKFTHSGASDGPTVAEVLRDWMEVIFLSNSPLSLLSWLCCHPFITLGWCPYTRKDTGNLKTLTFLFFNRYNNFSKAETVTTLYYLEVDRNSWWIDGAETKPFSCVL